MFNHKIVTKCCELLPALQRTNPPAPPSGPRGEFRSTSELKERVHFSGSENSLIEVILSVSLVVHVESRCGSERGSDTRVLAAVLTLSVVNFHHYQHVSVQSPVLQLRPEPLWAGGSQTRSRPSEEGSVLPREPAGLSGPQRPGERLPVWIQSDPVMVKTVSVMSDMWCDWCLSEHRTINREKSSLQ